MSQPKPNLEVLKSDPYRTEVILEHREVRRQLYQLVEGHPELFPEYIMTSPSIEIEQTTTTTFTSFMSIGPLLEELKHPEIFLRDMEKPKENKEHLYSGRTLLLTLIDDPMLGYASMNLVAEDRNKDVIHLSIYDIPQDRKTCEKYRFGTVIGVVNPFLDGKYGIRVDHPERIFHLGRKKDMCRYCGEENAEKKCKDCGRRYCNRRCQMQDLRMLRHEMVCDTPVAWSVNESCGRGHSERTFAIWGVGVSNPEYGEPSFRMTPTKVI